MKILSVSELTSQIKTTISHNFSNICVEGEIGNITKHQSGHYYFTLKDDKASIKCVLFKGNSYKVKFELKTDISVKIEGNVNVYENRGEYQIICTNITQGGIGDLTIKFEKLKEKLREKGYFESKFKKKIPIFPKKIAFITSLSGAALQDMKFVSQKRWNLLEVSIFDTLVQGNEAKNTISQNIKIADSLGFDIIIIARGGGSLEDLWSFNEEIVLDAIFEAKTPIISAIGHESDFLLSDLVSDLRAPTPSSCMEIILPDKNEWMLRLSEFLENLTKIQSNNLNKNSEILKSLESKMAFYKIDYERFNKELLSLYQSFEQSKERILTEKSIMLDSLSKILDSEYKNLYPLKEQNLKYLKDKINIITLSFLKNKITLEINSKDLLFKITSFLTNKNNNLESLKNILEAKNPKKFYKKGFVQITKKNIVMSLEELNKDDAITLSDGVITKDAKII